MRAPPGFRRTSGRAGGRPNANRTPPPMGRSSTSSCTSLPLRLEDAHLGQREAVELARIGRGIGGGVADVDEVALLEVRMQRLITHHPVHPDARRASDLARDVRT